MGIQEYGWKDVIKIVLSIEAKIGDSRIWSENTKYFLCFLSYIKIEKSPLISSKLLSFVSK